MKIDSLIFIFLFISCTSKSYDANYYEKNEIKPLNDGVLKSISIEDIVIDDIKLFNLEDKEVSLNYLLLQNGPVIIFRWFENNCHDCIHNVFLELGDLSKSLEHSKILAFTDVEDMKYLQMLKKKYNSKVNIYSLKKQMVHEIDSLGRPYIGIINSEKELQHGFYVNSSINNHITRIRELGDHLDITP